MPLHVPERNGTCLKDTVEMKRRVVLGAVYTTSVPAYAETFSCLVLIKSLRTDDTKVLRLNFTMWTSTCEQNFQQPPFDILKQ